MLSAIGTMLLVVSLILSGGGATVAAAQSSLPDEPLYPVKTWSEDVRASLTENEPARLQLAMMLFNRRAEEIRAMVEAGEAPPEAVLARLQAQIDAALQIAAGQDAENITHSLLQIRVQMQTQQQAFQQIGPPEDRGAQGALEQTRNLLQNRLRLCDDGLNEPTRLQQHLHNRLHDPQNPAASPGQQQNQGGEGGPSQQGQHNQSGDQEGVQIHDRDQDRIHQPENVNPPEPQTGGNSYGPGPSSGGEQSGEPAQGDGYGPGPQPTDRSSGSHNGENTQSDGHESGGGGNGNHH